MERHLKLNERFAKLNKKQKGIALILLTLFLGLLFLVVCYFVGKIFIWMTIFPEGVEPLSPIHYALNEFLTPTLIIYSFLLFGLINRLYTGKRNTITGTDSRGAKTMAQGSYGSSKEADEPEIKRNFNVCDIADTNEMIYGQLTQDGQGVRTLSYLTKTKGSEGNRSALIIASSGRGKTYAEVLGNIIKCVNRGHSTAVVDPSGEIYSYVGQYCRDNDYDVKLLNLKDLDYSDNWDCLQETVDNLTERLTDSRLRSFANIFMRNSTKVKGQDFWYESAQNLIEATIGLVAVRRERKILEQYTALYEKITNQQGSDFGKKLDKFYVPFPWCREQILKACVEQKYNDEQMEQVNAILDEIIKKAPKFNIEEVYKVVNQITVTGFGGKESSDPLLLEFETLPEYHPAAQAFSRFRANTKDTVLGGAIQGAQLKFKIFDDYKLRHILSTPGIDFKTINLRKSAYFVAIPDTDNSFTPICSLFFSFFFKDVQETYDYEQSLKIKENRENKCIPVMAMLDEFASLGVLTGDEEQFSTYMSDMRKRKLYAWIIVQYYSQLEGLYGKFAKNGILSNCETTIFLGGNDADTLKWVSEKSGVMTTASITSSQTDTAVKKYENEVIRISEHQKNVYNADEAGMIMDTVLIMKQGCHPFTCYPLPWVDAPEYLEGRCVTKSYFETIERLKGEYENDFVDEKKVDNEAHIHRLIDGLNGKKNSVDPEQLRANAIKALLNNKNNMPKSGPNDIFKEMPKPNNNPNQNKQPNNQPKQKPNNQNQQQPKQQQHPNQNNNQQNPNKQNQQNNQHQKPKGPPNEVTQTEKHINPKRASIEADSMKAEKKENNSELSMPD